MKRLRNKMFIYALINPITNKVFYIGQSKNVYVRVLEHINKSHFNKTPKDEMLTDLFSKSIMPKYEILEEININIDDKSAGLKVSERERYWIEFYSKDGWVSNKQGYVIKEIDNNPHLQSVKCLFCGKETKAKTAKKKFCSDLHRVYWNRENKKIETLKSNVDFKPTTKDAYDSKKFNHYLADEFGQMGTINPKPPRLEGESSIDYKIRMAELNETKL